MNTLFTIALLALFELREAKTVIVTVTADSCPLDPNVPMVSTYTAPHTVVPTFSSKPTSGYSPIASSGAPSSSQVKTSTWTPSSSQVRNSTVTANVSQAQTPSGAPSSSNLPGSSSVASPSLILSVSAHNDAAFGASDAPLTATATSPIPTSASSVQTVASVSPSSSISSLPTVSVSSPPTGSVSSLPIVSIFSADLTTTTQETLTTTIFRTITHTITTSIDYGTTYKAPAATSVISDSTSGLVSSAVVETSASISDAPSPTTVAAETELPSSTGANPLTISLSATSVVDSTTTTPASSADNTTPSTTSSSAPPAQTSDAFAQTIVDYHNQVRAIHQAPPMEWDQSLADFASSYLDTVIPTCNFAHSGGPNGENLALGYPTTLAGLQAWYDENTLYDYEAAQFSHETGHFTQMVWVGSTRVGCAHAKCADSRDYLVCEYAPRGNIIGWFADNVLPPKN